MLFGNKYPLSGDGGPDHEQEKNKDFLYLHLVNPMADTSRRRIDGRLHELKECVNLLNESKQRILTQMINIKMCNIFSNPSILEKNQTVSSYTMQERVVVVSMTDGLGLEKGDTGGGGKPWVGLKIRVNFIKLYKVTLKRFSHS